MDLKQLHYFVTVVEEGTISAAAKKLFMSQPPLSAQMKHLEGEFGCTLFQRGQRQVQLTEAGRRLYEKALVLLEISRVTSEELSEYASAEAGTIRIGIVSSVVCPTASEWIADFSAQHPEVRFAIHEANTYDLIEKVRSNLAHLAIVRTPYAAEDMTSQPLGNETLMAVGRAELFPAGDAALTPLALSSRPILLYRRWESVIKGEFEKDDATFDCRCMCDDARTVVDLVGRGVGIGLVPASAIRLVTDPGLVCRPFALGRIQSRIDLIYRKNGSLPSFVRAFADYLVQRSGSGSAPDVLF